MASSPAHHQVYQVEHLATFSTQQQTTPKIALQRLFAMEKTSGIWTQSMAIEIDGRDMKIIDGDSGDAVERFPVSMISQPTAFNHQNHIYDNILIFTVQHPEETTGELHIFQCNSHSAQQVVDDLNHWMRRHGNTAGTTEVNVNVKETVHVFNAIAAQRETRKSTSPAPTSAMRVSTNGHHHRDQGDSRSITTNSSIDSSGQNGHRNGSSSDQSLTNERFVSILNHCFDDIERFIIRLQHAAAALRELQQRNHKRHGKSGHTGDGLLAVRAKGPTEEEFYEIFAKFKLAFNLLARLKGCIHDPNAPELVHFLFTPLAIIIEAARGNASAPVDPSAVGVPFLNSDAIELLSNCCTSKEYDLWQSLGINWTQPVRPHLMQSPRVLPTTFQPVFSDGWSPIITEAELMGFVSSDHEEETIPLPSLRGEERPTSAHRRISTYDDSDADELIHGHHNHSHSHHSPVTRHNGKSSSNSSSGNNNPHNNSSHHSNGHSHNGPTRRFGQSSSPSPIESDSLGRDSPSGNPSEIEQVEWLSELQSSGAKIVKVLFPRIANNDKELTVVRGEYLEILDDSRKWWKARNSRGVVAHVPHTIVTEVPRRECHPSMDSPNSEDWIRKERQATATAAATATLSPAVASASLERKTHGPIVKTSGKSTCELVGLDHYHPASGGSGDVAIGGGGGGVGISLSGGENQIDCSNCHGFTHSSAITSVNKRIEMAPVSSSLISHKEIPRRQKEAIVSTCALTLITCHLFNKGFKGEFIDSIIIRLREDQKVTGISPRQVFTWNNQQILQKHLQALNCDEGERQEFFQILFQTLNTIHSGNCLLV